VSTELVPVRVGDCQCPGSPHPDGDLVYLRPRLGLAAGIAIQRLIVEANQDRADSAEISGQLAEAYLLHGVAGWNLVGEGEGEKPIPVNEDSIRLYLLSDFVRSAPVADAADDLYMAAVLGPLVNRALASSPTTSTSGSTSATRRGKSKAPRPSKPSSTTTTRTAATATTSR
jgi:hypothetical protein